MRFGELLVMNGFITEEQLQECLREQAQTKRKLGTLLLEHGYITERQLVEVLEFQLGFPSITLYNAEIDKSLISLVPEALAQKYSVIPVRKAGGKLVLAMQDPLDYNAIEEIRLAAKLNVQPVIAMRSEIEQAITRHYGLQDTVDQLMEDFGPLESADAVKEAHNQESPIVKLVNQIIHAAVVQRASDIHIEPQEQQVVIRYRVDGVLHTEKTLPKHMQNVLIARLKILAKLNIAERRLPQDGRIQMQADTRPIDIRVSTLPAASGESVVLRILDQSIGIKRLKDIGLSEQHYEAFEHIIRKPNGIVLISGPTGSGKTSTLYSAIHRLNKPDVKIVTVEDPVEYRMNGITQVQVNAQIGLTFASGLRSILRQDPNIVMVGEVRDAETAEIAVRASLTGHLVLSTIHTNSALDTITRLIDMGVEPYLIASSLNGVAAQRLVRSVCRECAVRVPARPDEIQLFRMEGLQARRLSTGTEGTAHAEDRMMVVRGRGCPSCNKTGYKGRLAIHEVLVIDEGLRRLIARNASLEELKQHAGHKGFRTLLQDGLSKALSGQTTVDELLKAVAADE